VQTPDGAAHERGTRSSVANSDLIVRHRWVARQPCVMSGDHRYMDRHHRHVDRHRRERRRLHRLPDTSHRRLSRHCCVRCTGDRHVHSPHSELDRHHRHRDRRHCDVERRRWTVFPHRFHVDRRHRERHGVWPRVHTRLSDVLRFRFARPIRPSSGNGLTTGRDESPYMSKCTRWQNGLGKFCLLFADDHDETVDHRMACQVSATGR